MKKLKLAKPLKIAISGKSGCGNSTLCRLLSETLDIPQVNYTLRNLAQDKGISFDEIRALAEKSDDIDIELDTKLVNLVNAQQSCILGTRLAIWLIKDADLKIYLNISEKERVRRIVEREGGNPEEQLAYHSNRDARDTARYKRIYGIDNNNFESADIIINAPFYNAEEICNIVLAAIPKKHF